MRGYVYDITNHSERPLTIQAIFFSPLKTFINHFQGIINNIKSPCEVALHQGIVCLQLLYISGVIFFC